MRIAAVICEFNPFHNGHAYLLGKIRKELGADHIIAIMSGNYVQRGEPAVFDKYIRTAAALKGDGADGYADLVIELPTLFSTAPAGEFAQAGVKTALLSGIADFMCFGTEEGITLRELEGYAELLDDESPEASEYIRELLRSGYTYPKAVSRAAAFFGGREIPGISSANNILAAEYLRALKKYDPERRITPIAIARVGDNYSMEYSADSRYCSATYLRKILKSSAADSLGSFIPHEAERLYRAASPVYPDAFSLVLSKVLLDAAYLGLPLEQYAGISPDIARRLVNRADLSLSFTERVLDTKTKQYTYTRISRALLAAAIGITDKEKASAISEGMISYLKILGFRRSSAGLLSLLKAAASVPVITKTADHRELLKQEIRFSNLYYQAALSSNEYERSPVIIP